MMKQTVIAILFMFSTLGDLYVTASELFVRRINVGSTDAYVDPDGLSWEADKYFDGKGAMYSQCPMDIADTKADALYCKERYYNIWAEAQPYRYTIPVPRKGAYSVKLHFAEIFVTTKGGRIFNVMVNGKTVAAKLDIFDRVGANTALVIPITTKITGDNVIVELIPIKQNPKICAIEVLEVSDYVEPPTTAPVEQPSQFVTRINVGSADKYVDPDGVSWEADKYFEGKGSTYSQCPIVIANTNADALYCKERYYNIWAAPHPYRYVIPVPRQGAYSVKLHFAEIFATAKGERVFDVMVNGKTAAAKLDIFDRVGANTALIIPITTKVTGDNVIVELIPFKQNPKICAIEVMEESDYVEPPTGAPVEKPFALLINCGGNSFVEAVDGRTWTEDQYYFGGDTYGDGSKAIANSLNDNLYQTERYGEFEYEIPVPASGNYQVILHFAELYWERIGERVFDVNVDDIATFENVDIVELGNGKRLQAVTLESIIEVFDGYISIYLSNHIPQIDNAKLSGIEIAALP